MLRSQVARARQAALLGGSLWRFLSSPITLDRARAELRARVDDRERNFFRVARRLIFDQPASPYLSLLRWAGCEAGDLQATVMAEGLEGALDRLRDAGVYLTYDEFRGRQPIVRDGLVLETTAVDFDNPLLMGRTIGGRTSGTSSAPRRVAFDWLGLDEEAAENLVLLEAHGLQDAALAVWLPMPAGVSGLHALMINAKRGHPPDACFSPIAADAVPKSLLERFGMRYIPLVARAAGVRFCRIEPAGVDDAVTVAHWLSASRSSERSSVLRTCASAGVRVAEAAAANDVDLRGTAMLVGGEPLTSARRRAIEAAGARAVPLYGATEIGYVAGSCARPAACDDMHVFLDRLAVTVLRRELTPPAPALESLLFTSVSLDGRTVMLNAELGDHARLERRSCGCPLGELGLDLHVSEVRSHDKLTGEGMALLHGELDEAVAACVNRAGGGPNDYQFWERRGPTGATRLQLAVTPEVSIDEREFVESVLRELSNRAAPGSLVAHVWRGAGTLELVRARPEPTAALKMPPLRREAPEVE